MEKTLEALTKEGLEVLTKEGFEIIEIKWEFTQYAPEIIIGISIVISLQIIIKLFFGKMNCRKTDKHLLKCDKHT